MNDFNEEEEFEEMEEFEMEEEGEEEKYGEESEKSAEELSINELVKGISSFEKKNELLQGEIDIMRIYNDEIKKVDEIEYLDGESHGSSQQNEQKYNVSWDQRIEVVSRVIDLFQSQRNKELVQAELNKECNIKVGLQNLNEEKKLIQKDEDEFRRFVVRSNKTGKIVSERIEKYMVININQKEKDVERYKKKARKQRLLNRKLSKRVDHTNQMNEKLSRIDFDQLKIENSQMREREESLSEEIIRLKLSTGKTQQVLTSLMEKLSHLQSRQKKFVSIIREREKKLKDLENKIQNEEKEKNKQEKKNESLKKHHAMLRVPEVLEYVKVKSDLDLLRKEVVNWERKVSIAKMNESLFSVKHKKTINEQRSIQYGY